MTFLWNLTSDGGTKELLQDKSCLIFNSVPSLCLGSCVHSWGWQPARGVGAESTALVSIATLGIQIL